ncbi:MAG: DEAD/DEAH box helicase [Myxococcales bacterium]|nr:DEAD/DEAH box helicase [Myxococcales bacterium]
MFHPVVEAWFTRRFGSPTAAQAEAWPLIAAGRNVLITAPTGSGKTLAAFLACLDHLVKRALGAPDTAEAATQGSLSMDPVRDDARGAPELSLLSDETAIVYVSPLKALSNDVRRNLETPLAEISETARAMGLALPPLRTALRTGDTSVKERREAVRKPPHILVTTPESLYILLTSESGRRGLRHVRTVIVDEIHAMAADKRGSHLALSLERLEALVGRPVQRIGLSATIYPLETASRLLVGARPAPAVVNAARPRTLDLAIEIPRDELGAVCTNEQWGELYDRVAEFARQHRSTLVFVNTRRLVERLAHNLSARLGEAAVGAHHGSLSRERRFQTEQRLKAGDLQLVVATASLELGIDVGAVDLVCLVGSPRTIATGVQRIGRASHTVGGTPKARLFPLTRDQLVECAGLVRAARRGTLDRVELRTGPLDILAQQLVAACACETWEEDALFELVRRAAPYDALTRADFDAVVDMLAEGISTSRGRPSALLHRDAVNRRLRARNGARLTALTSGGAIPDTALFEVVLEPEGTLIGTVDEDFAIDSSAGDVILLGNTSWRIRRVENGKVRVEDAAGAPPSVPFWFGEGPARTLELSDEVGELREEIARRACPPSELDVSPARIEPALLRSLSEGSALCEAGAKLLAGYVAAGHAALGAVPSQRCIVAERFFDESGGTQLVIHAPFGGRINRAWGMALRKRFCRSFDFELQAAATDEGVLLSLSPQHSFPLELILQMLRPNLVDELLTQAALQAPMFETRWRWNATRALALRRTQNGKRVPPNLLRMRSQDLLAAVFPGQVACQDNHGGGPIEVPDHPLVKQTLADCLGELMDAEGLKRVLEDLVAGRIATVVRETTEPSVFAHEILNANPYAFLDDAPLEERRSRAVAVRRGLPAELANSLGQLDPQALASVVEAAAPLVRSADELHDLLLEVGVWPAAEGEARGWTTGFTRLEEERRAGVLGLAGAHPPKHFWVAAERLSLVKAIWPDASVPPGLIEPPARRAHAWEGRDGALTDVVRGHMAFSPPLTAEALAERLGVTTSDAEAALAGVEAQGGVMRGRWTDPPPPAHDQGREQWVDRRLLARANRLTVEGLRRGIEPATPADLMRFLFAWQHVGPGRQLTGRDGLLEIVGQLQGFEAAAVTWERDLLPARLAGYDPGWLDDLCLGGHVSWGKLAPRAEPSTSLTRAAPLSLVLRRELPWLLEPVVPPSGTPAEAALSEPAQSVFRFLQEAGASFLDDLVVGLGLGRNEVETALWELVAAGRISADGFANLRALMPDRRQPARPRWFGSTGARSSARFGAGRWSLLRGPALQRGVPPEDARREQWARQCLRRFGVLFRDLLAREAHAPPWRELLPTLRLMEMRGEIRGGRLVEGFVGEQFALPEALEALRHTRKQPPTGTRTTLSACDPLNLIGITSPGARVPALPHHTVTYIDGVPLTHELVTCSDTDVVSGPTLTSASPPG